jgi:PAS domain S-box-containing protein
MSETTALPPVPHKYLPVSMTMVVVSFVVVAVLSIVFILTFYTARKAQIRENVAVKLATVADMKAEAIVNWRSERLADAALFGSSPGLIHLLKTIWPPVNREKSIESLLDPVVKLKRYRSAAVFDSTATVVLKTSRAVWMPDEYDLQPYFERVMKYGVPLMTDLHQFGRLRENLHLCLLSPIKDQKTAKVYGVLMLEVDPDDFFFPTIQSWPGESKSAEVLLVRRDGDSVVVLNELRHKKSTALSFRLPVTSKALPMAKAVAGFTGTMEGRDYRDSAVLAEIRAVPSTPWFMIAKIDTKEAFSALNQLFRQTLASMLFMVLLLVSFGILYQRYRSTLIYNKLGRAESEKKALSSSLQQSELLFRSVFDAMPEGVTINEILFDKNGIPSDFRLLNVNTAYEKITGVPAEKARGARASELYHDPTDPLFKEYFSVGMNGKSRLLETYIPFSKQYFSISACCLGNNRFATIFQDITEQKKAREALVLEKERLAVTLQSIGDAVIATNVDGGITLMNRAAEQCTGWTKEESEGKSLLEIFNVVDPARRRQCVNPVTRVFETGQVFNLENDTILVKKNGTDITIESCCAPICDSAGIIIGTTVVFRDITEKIRIEEAMQKNNKLEALGSLAAGIAHDFNNLLGGLFGYLDLARDSAASGGEVTQYIEKAFSVFSRTKDLTAQLLTFAKGGVPLRKKVFMPPFIRDTVQFALGGNTMVKPVYSIDEHLWHSEVDERQLAQTIENITINARDAMPQGGKIIISAENCPPGYAVPLTLAPGRYICIRVRDEGIGIAPEHLSFIFDPFFTTKQKGSGLGLSIALSVVNRHGGTIEVSSGIGKGTAFSIFLPASENVAVERYEPALSENHYGEGPVIVMDDENYICEVTTAMLSGMGYMPVAVATGEEAIAEVEKRVKSDRQFVFALLDLSIPGAMGGLEAGTAIKKIDPEIRVVAMSGYSEDPVIAHPEKYGFDGSITKPYFRAILEETIVAVMRPKVSAYG